LLGGPATFARDNATLNINVYNNNNNNNNNLKAKPNGILSSRYHSKFMYIINFKNCFV